MRRALFLPFAPLALVLLAGSGLLAASCSSPDDPPSPPACALAGKGLPEGDPNGHADPLGAKAAGQARAGRIQDVASVAQPAHGRQRIEAGDFLLINDKIAIVIEDKGLSDGYARFGGEILSIDKVGEDGKPMGLSRYIETLVGTSVETVNPTSVTVLRDGSDGGEAVVRATGPLETIPFMDGPLRALFPRAYGHPVAYDYVLSPGSEKLLVRLSFLNPTLEPINFGVNQKSKDELYGFFQYNQAQLVTAEYGYEEPSGDVAWAGFDSGPWGFAWRTPGNPIEYGLTVSGFTLFWGEGFIAEACSITTEDQFEVIPGGPHFDGLAETVRRAAGEPPFRAIAGTLVDGAGAPVAEAYIHEVDPAGKYLSRTMTDEMGAFTIHAPPSQEVRLIAQKRGYPAHAGALVAASEATADLSFSPHARIHVVATDSAKGEPLPVRVQVIPKEPVAEAPEAFGVLDEVNGRLHQEFAVTGDAMLPVPPGEHRVIVSRGFEWEIFDTTVTAAAGETAEVAAALEHSVDTTGWMCADFHIHSLYSADSNDSVEEKVKSAIADGLDIPVSSEHEWVIDFQPVIQSMGLGKWAFGMSSQELTTFTWGHFGVVPREPHPEEVNNGAVEWIGKTPGEIFENVKALPEKPALIVNHPSGDGFTSYFTASHYDHETGHGDPELWSPLFDAVEVFNDSDLEENRKKSVADWFSLLNHGKTVWAVGSSDSHHIRTSPVGYPRTCLWIGHDDPTKLTAGAVRDALLLGTATVSGGLFMTVTGPGGEKPGQTIGLAPGSEATFTVTVEAPGYLMADTLETIVNGVTVNEEPLLPIGNGPSKKFINEVTVTIDPSVPRSWVVFHAKGEADLAPLHPGRKPFAVSNPIFIGVN
ncbi:MAG: CehA/McbA family metallohydrolase [Polyangiaceae bacterium]|nr:CehA/McbA family metallohydrolase [Polyangiaceae bacterium]